MIKNGVDETAVEGTADTSYVIPNFHVSAHHPVVNVPVLWVALSRAHATTPS